MYGTLNTWDSVPRADLAPDKCPVVKNAINFGDPQGLTGGGNITYNDLVGDVVINIGGIGALTTSDSVSTTFATLTVDASLGAGSWNAVAGGKHGIFINMCDYASTTGSPVNIIGNSIASGAGEGAVLNATRMALWNGTAFDLTEPTNYDDETMAALVYESSASLKAISASKTDTQVTAANTTSIPASLSPSPYVGWGDIRTFGRMVIVLNNLPTDEEIARALAYMRKEWAAGNFVVAPNMLSWS